MRRNKAQLNAISRSYTKRANEQALAHIKYIYKCTEKDIEEFKEKKRTIVSYVPSSSVDVETFTKDGYDWARLYCIYGIKQDGLLYNSNIVFILKKDENSHYKIYGWKLVQKDN